ncbi:hypothetical protein VST7929_01056 [Vibrio stylophorae]|uniref:HTH-type transcriptional regulator MT1864/Rv1816-like C-terminal domain-containing protein n=1 Tax=Vibrio stylophorae TaxID=659351 RepID=A0ABM8ZSC0_9VIBR|nr:TetR/AcrR family transcriptional regulator [Vibrio stylophorae]CAH0533194.1 hypothetical protein VST7929_01056 [Vibrio stylophorae]
MARRNDHTHEQLIHITLTEVNQFLENQPYHALSLRKIAAMIGYAPSTLINLFGSYDMLLLHVVSTIVDRLTAEITAAVEIENDPQQQLRVMAKCYLQFAKANPYAWQLVFAHSMGGEQLPSWQQHRIDHLLGLIETMVAKLGPKLDAEATMQTSRVLWAGVHGITLLAVDDKLFTAQPVDAGHLIDNLLQHYLASWSK